MELEPGRYKITNVKGGTVLDLSGADNESIIGYSYGGGDNQHWDLERTDDGWYVKSASTGAYLSISGSAENGTKLVASGDPFLWHMWRDEQNNDAWRLCVPDTQQVMDLSDHGNSDDGTPVTLWWTWEGTNQTWLFEQV